MNELESIIRILNNHKSIVWYQNRVPHRLNGPGPAVEWVNGDKRWYQNGMYHRLDGPAVEYTDGNKY